MARFCGKIGYAETKETRPSIYEEVITEHKYYGDVKTNQWKKDSNQSINDDAKVNVQISIVADEKALTSFHLMRWIEWKGVKWSIANIDVQPPRIILTIGGVYNEE